MFFVMLILKLSCLFVCYQIIFFLLNGPSVLGTFFCPVSSVNNCRQVLQSPFSRVTKTVHIVDVGVVYYLTHLIYFIFSGLFLPHDMVLIPTFLPLLAAVCFTIVGMFYQKYIIKSWCKLCILLYVLVWVEFIAMLIWINGQEQGFEYSLVVFFFDAKFLPLILSFIASFLLSLSWLIVKSQMFKARENNAQLNQIIKLKKDHNFFKASLALQKKIDNISIESELLIGNVDSKHFITLVINPFCKGCKAEFLSVKRLQSLYPSLLAIKIRFIVFSDPSTKTYKVVSSILYQYLNGDNNIGVLLSKWFENNVSDQRYWSLDIANKALVNNEVSKFIKAHEEWHKKNEIKETPLVFFDNLQIPSFYRVADLPLLLFPK